MLTAVLTVTTFTLLARGVRGFGIEPFTLNTKLETDCSERPPENQLARIPDISYPFRTDVLTFHECKAYEEVPCSPFESDRCKVDRYGKPDLASISPFNKTYFELDCTGYGWKDNPGGWRSFIRAYTKKFSIISPKRALTMKIKELNDMKDPVHSDVFDPVRDQVIDISVDARASTRVTTKIYNSGILPSLVSLRVENGKSLSIKRHDFNRIPNVRLIVFHKSSILEIEPHTFTDLPHLSSLSVDKGLLYIFNEIDNHLRGEKGWRGARIWDDADLDLLRRMHCDCSFAWYRNFLKFKGELLESKLEGAMAVIGNYMSEYFVPFGIDSHVASVDCAKDLTKDNYEAGIQFSYNTTCFGSC